MVASIILQTQINTILSTYSNLMENIFNFKIDSQNILVTIPEVSSGCIRGLKVSVVSMIVVLNVFSHQA